MENVLQEAKTRANKLLEQLRQDAADLDQPHRIEAQKLAEGKAAIHDAIYATERFIESLTANQD